MTEKKRKMNEMSAPRTNMVNSQILTNKVTDDRVTAALLSVPREKFVPKAMAGVAYVDEHVEVGGCGLALSTEDERVVWRHDVGEDKLRSWFGALLGKCLKIEVNLLASTFLGLADVLPRTRSAPDS